MRRHTSLRTKLLALLSVPLLVLAALAGLGVRWASEAAARSRTTARHMELYLVASGAALELELERGLSAGEKRMLAKARDILVGEVALAEKSTKDEEETLLDKVLTEA